ncbi:hypothetical protein SB783_28665 [Paraburkholderia sp. SIMBA_009]|uniref:hypothetical protein n=1 Tax=Paraburkholderia tropica TaxID=92647 RepID=UPI000A5A4B4B|nr:hypothetical protein [Paraburkholderia tropica]RQN34336.1 hypothetical protein EHZ25_34925 [Paraburkholderia tropica]
MTVNVKRRMAACVACLVLAACSDHSAVSTIAALPLVFSGTSPTPPLTVADCVMHDWKLSTHNLALTSTRAAWRISASSWFQGVELGVVLRRRSHRTRAEFFEGRIAPSRYLAIVQHCLVPGGHTTGERSPELRTHAATLR